MNAEQIRATIFALPEVRAWPEMAAVFERTNGTLSREWELPWLACQAVGGRLEEALPAAAALACIQLSIVVVDDMLDNDPRGDYHTLGNGPTANLALAFQAAAFALVKTAPIGPERRAGLTAWLAHIGLGTALGQYYDAQNHAGDEAAYWQVVRGKSGPFYGAAVAMGALVGGGPLEVVSAMNDLGQMIGEMAQIYDDLGDALHTPARPDWEHGRNNLTILYALTANYADKERFVSLVPQVADPAALRAAQQILLSSGAVSYCAAHAARRYRAAQNLLSGLNLPNKAPLADALSRQTKPLQALFEVAGAELPPEFIHG
jgi:geranylgeranyl diphosphate synthase type I